MNDFERLAERIRTAYTRCQPFVRTEDAHELLGECEAAIQAVERDRDVLVARLERELDEARSERARIEADGDRVRTELWAAQAGVAQAKEVFERLTADLVRELPTPWPRARIGVRR